MYYEAYYADGFDTSNELPEEMTLEQARYWAERDNIDGFGVMRDAPTSYIIYDDEDNVLFEKK